MSSSDESNKSNGGALSLPFVLFILNIVVIANTSRDDFKALGHELYYQFEFFNLVGLGVFFAYFIIYICGQAGAVATLNKRLSLILNIGLVVLIVSLITTTLYYMGSIWHGDPNHSIFYYPEYWKESVMDFSCHNTTDVVKTDCRVYDKKWAYVMSDVVVRIYSFLFMILFSIVLPIIVCCFGGLKLMMKKEDSVLPSSF